MTALSPGKSQHLIFRIQKVEVGGFKPLVDLNPPAKELDGITAEKQLKDFVPNYPKLELRDAKARQLQWRRLSDGGNGQQRWRYFPTCQNGECEWGCDPLQIEIKRPKRTVFLQGARSEIGRESLADSGWHAR